MEYGLNSNIVSVLSVQYMLRYFMYTKLYIYNKNYMLFGTVVKYLAVLEIDRVCVKRSSQFLIQKIYFITFQIVFIPFF